MYLVTGGLGFIGSNIVKYLHSNNPNEKIYIVDKISSREKYLNLPSIRNIELFEPDDIDDLLSYFQKNNLPKCIYHMGACSSTTENDGTYLYQNNYKFSKKIIDFSVNNNIFIINASSASVYGIQQISYEDTEFEKPINHYAFTKLLVDQYIHQKLNSNSDARILSLRFFNVYGYGEFAKGNMASLPFKIYIRLINKKPIQLFGSYAGFDKGKQLRDFIYVDDILDIMKICIEEDFNGIYNLGTSVSRTFNDLAIACLNSFNELVNNKKEKYNINEAIDKNLIEYIDFPDEFVGKYQAFTEAKMDKLFKKGIDYSFTSLEAGIFDYYSKLNGFY